MLSTASLALLWAAIAAAHSGHADQSPIAGPHQSLWYNTLPGDGGTQVSFPLSSSIKFHGNALTPHLRPTLSSPVSPLLAACHILNACLLKVVRNTTLPSLVRDSILSHSWDAKTDVLLDLKAPPSTLVPRTVRVLALDLQVFARAHEG